MIDGQSAGANPQAIAAAIILACLDAPGLYQEAIRRREGGGAPGGALVVETVQHTGRSRTDKVIARNAATEGAIRSGNDVAAPSGRRAAACSASAQDLGRQGGVRRSGAQARRPVH